MSNVKSHSPLAVATWHNQICQTTLSVQRDGTITSSVGHFGKIYDGPSTKLSPDEFVAFKAALKSAESAPLVKKAGTQTTTFGSENGSFVAGRRVIKDVERGDATRQGKDSIEVRDDSDAVKQALDLLAAHLPAPFDITDGNGQATTLSPALMPSVYDEG